MTNKSHFLPAANNLFTSSATRLLLRMICYSVMTQAYSEKEIPSSPNRSRTYELPFTCSDALPLSYRRHLHFTFTILQAFPLYKAYMLGFGQVRKGS